MNTHTPPRLTATEVTALDPYAFFAVLGKRMIHPGGRRATEELCQRADKAERRAQTTSTILPLGT